MSVIQERSTLPRHSAAYGFVKITNVSSNSAKKKVDNESTTARSGKLSAVNTRCTSCRDTVKSGNTLAVRPGANTPEADERRGDRNKVM